MSTTNRSAEKSSSTLGLIGTGVSYVALCLTALAAIILVIIPLATGSQTYSVLTSSMAPKYAPGTFLVVKPVPFEELRVGDVITYQIESGKPAVITHRITSVSAAQNGELEFTTKGDNNDVEDKLPVREAQVRGKLFYAVPFVGFAANALGNSDRGAALQWGAVALMGYGVVSLVRGALAKRRDDTGSNDAGSGDPSDEDPGAGDGPATAGEDIPDHVAGNDDPTDPLEYDDPTDPLEYDDPRLDDCDACEHPRRHGHATGARKHATV